MDNLNAKVVNSEELEDLTEVEEQEKAEKEDNKEENQEVESEIIDINDYIDINDETVDMILTMAGQQFATINKIPQHMNDDFVELFKKKVYTPLKMVGFTESFKNLRIKQLPNWLRLALGAAIIGFTGISLKSEFVEVE